MESVQTPLLEQRIEAQLYAIAYRPVYYSRIPCKLCFYKITDSLTNTLYPLL